MKNMKNVTKQECNSLGFQQNPKNKSLYTYKLDDNGRCLNVEFAKDNCISLYVYNSFTGIVFGLGEFTVSKPLSLDMLKLFVSSFGSSGNQNTSDSLGKTKENLRNKLVQIYQVAKTKLDAFDASISIDLTLGNDSSYIDGGMYLLKNKVGYNDWQTLLYKIDDAYQEIFESHLDSYFEPLELTENAFNKLCSEVSQMLIEISKNDSSDGHSTRDSSFLLDFLFDISQYPLPYTFNKIEHINEVIGYVSSNLHQLIPHIAYLKSNKSVYNEHIAKDISHLNQILLQMANDLGNQNIVVTEFCRQMGISAAQFYGKEQIKSDLDWEHLEYVPEGICLDVIGHIDLRNLKQLPSNTTLKATKWIELSKLTRLDENCLIAGVCVFLDSLTELAENCALSVRWDLDLPYLTKLNRNCSLSTDNILSLCRLTEIPENCILRAGRDLYLRSLTEIPKHCAVDVKRRIYLKKE